MRSTMRNLVHNLFSILLWILFGYYWYVVSGRRISWETFEAVLVLAIISLAGLLVTLWWVQHNLAIAGRNRRAGARGVRPETLTHDTLRRPIAGPGLAVLKSAKRIVVGLDDQGRKTYAANAKDQL